MRALFEDIVNNTDGVEYSGIVMSEVGIPTDGASRRDLWFKFVQSDSLHTLVEVYKTRDMAAADKIASAAITNAATSQTVALTQYLTRTPDITGQVIVGTFASSSSGKAYRWGYTAAPDLVVCDNITYLLQARVAAGQSLYGIDLEAIYTGDETEAEAMPLIAVVAQPVELDLSINAGSTMTMVCPIEVHVAVDMLSTPQIAWRTCREYMAAVESILHDEERRSYGECLTLYRQSSSGPGPAAGKPSVMTGIVRIAAVFPYVWRDDAYPRS